MEIPRALVFASLGVALLGAFALLGIELVGAFAPDPLGELCLERMYALPEVVPSLLVFNVTDQHGKRLAPQDEDAARSAAEAAVRVYPFAHIVRVVSNDSALAESVSDDVHVAELQFWVGESLPSRFLEPAAGRMCGNVVLVQMDEGHEYNVWSVKHEIGHYFGLPHHDDTYMNGRGDRSAERDVRSACQEEILAAWVPGEPYVAHWVHGNAGECAWKWPWWQKFNPLR